MNLHERIASCVPEYHAHPRLRFYRSIGTGWFARCFSTIPTTQLFHLWSPKKRSEKRHHPWNSKPERCSSAPAPETQRMFPCKAGSHSPPPQDMFPKLRLAHSHSWRKEKFRSLFDRILKSLSVPRSRPHGRTGRGTVCHERFPSCTRHAVPVRWP